jgi:hypothetical protein
MLRNAKQQMCMMEGASNVTSTLARGGAHITEQLLTIHSTTAFTVSSSFDANDFS